MLGPVISITSLYLLSVFLPVPGSNETTIDMDAYFLEGRKPFYIVMIIFIAQSQLAISYYARTEPQLIVLYTIPLILLSVQLNTIRAQKIAYTVGVALVLSLLPQRL